MAESLRTIKGNKQRQYENLLPQIKALLGGETDLIANLANISAALKEQFNWFWVGFYLIKDKELLVGPFQGPLACSRIAKGKGVCGDAWAKEKTITVKDVSLYPGHIACNSLARSEIVVPLFKNGEVQGVLDVDSDQLAAFDKIDKQYLEQLAAMIYG